MLNVFCRFGFSLLILGSLGLIEVRADKVDDFAGSLIRKQHIPGLSLAIIKDGKIVKAAGYGLADKAAQILVSTNTLFQAGSISKPVSALGVLHLVDSKKLSLDEDVNVKLTSWKLPENEWTKTEKVALRRILSHSAGLTVHGFPGYADGEPRPSLVQVLDGDRPANTKAIRVDIVPGSKVRYSGGGFTLMQQLMIDVSGEAFPTYMSKIVLKPLGMLNSTFEQPLPRAAAASAAQGYYANGGPVKGGYHIYPEMAAAGLWTTASDLARYALGVQQMLAGKGTPVISQQLAREMVTEQKEGVGLGLFLDRSGKNLRFKHSGRDEGFDALLVAYADDEAGYGTVLMINSNDNSGAMEQMAEFIAREYAWPSYP